MISETQFVSGAARSGDAQDLDFISISPVAMMALARTCAEGAKKYGRHNWELGMPSHDLLNHAIRHIYLHLAGDRAEPHLPHAFWGLMAAIHSEAMTPELNVAHMRGPGCTITGDMRDELRAGKPGRDARRAEPCHDGGPWEVDEVPEIARIIWQRLEQQSLAEEARL